VSPRVRVARAAGAERGAPRPVFLLDGGVDVCIGSVHRAKKFWEARTVTGETYVAYSMADGVGYLKEKHSP
jgi:hypothetical protein